MKTIILLRQAILFIILCLCCTSVFSQRVYDPSLADPAYNDRKTVLASKNKVTATAKSNTTALPSDVPACNIDNGCFIPSDDSYTEIPRNDDGYYGPITLPFTFNLYGSSYNQVWINTNGNLTFTNGYTGYVPSGFPITLPMVAAFWSDVDTRGDGSGDIRYKLTDTHLIVTWDSVGYYPAQVDKRNTFQIIIGVQGDPLLGNGNNVKFSYGKMEWAYAPATQTDGPTTVGVNKGDDESYIQVGRFYTETCDYDGPLGADDGIGYLEYQCLGFNVTNLTNIPPSASGFPNNDTLVLTSGDTVSLSPSFIGPEPGQIVTTTVDTGNLCNVTESITNGELSTVNLKIIGAACNVGTHVITFTATDNGQPVETTTVSLTVIVNPPVVVNTPPYFIYPPTPADGTEFDVQAGQPVSFTVQAADNDAGDNVALSATGLPAGAVSVPGLPASGNPVSDAFSWTPGASDVGTYTIQYQAADDSGSVVTTNIVISVSSVSACDTAFKAHAAVVPRYTVKGQAYHTIYKGYGLQRLALIARHSGGTAPFTYQWTDGSASYAHLVSPDTTTTYGLTITDASGCTATCSVTIYVVDVRCSTPGNIVICNGGQTMSVPKADVQGWLAQGAKLGSCNAVPAVAVNRTVVSMAALKPVASQAASAFSLYPNPAVSSVTLRWNTNLTSEAKVVVTDLQGKILMIQSVSGSSKTISVSQLASGVYMAKLVTANGTMATSRFVVSK